MHKKQENPTFTDKKVTLIRIDGKNFYFTRYTISKPLKTVVRTNSPCNVKRTKKKSSSYVEKSVQAVEKKKLFSDL